MQAWDPGMCAPVPDLIEITLGLFMWRNRSYCVIRLLLINISTDRTTGWAGSQKPSATKHHLKMQLGNEDNASLKVDANREKNIAKNSDS
jgi:hypothetical protein